MPWAGVEPLQLSEATPGSSWFVAGVTNAFDGVGTANADDWLFEAEAGDRVNARIESAAGGARPRLRILNAAGQTVASIDGTTAGVAELFNVVLVSPGTYRIRVYTDHQVSGYRLRMDLSRGPDLEVEPNDATNTANVLPARQLPGGFQFRVVGTLTTNDAAGDWFGLGTLDPGNSVSWELFSGPYSTLRTGDAQFSLFRLGQTNAVIATNASSQYVIVERGDYFARVSSSTNRDLVARYLLSVSVGDNVGPSVLNVTLPAEGGTSTDIIQGLTITFSEPLHPVTATNPANYLLRQPGPDGSFGTGDDVIYHLAVGPYSTGNTLTLTLVDGPVQLGLTRFGITASVTDRAGNPVSPAFTRSFSIERLGLFQMENRSNDGVLGATSLGVLGGVDGSFRVGGSYGGGRNPRHVWSGDLNGDGLWDWVVANWGGDSVSVWLGQGGGVLGLRRDYGVGDGPVGVVGGDLDGDGLRDLVVVNYNSDDLSVLRGVGGGFLGG
ncbi:MAG: Ig-like domain-containing protein [Verrucomicrobiota bacterium]|nr:Ig-like domain-containing protein [Verrucomicrobiota bacterium]